MNQNYYISANESFEKADYCILGVPYDGTSSYRPGSRFAPFSIREASHGLETYSPYLNKSLSCLSLCDLGDLNLPFGDTERSLKIIYKKVKKLLSHQKKFIFLGGEHLISYPLVKAYHNLYPDLIVIHYDAHADFRQKYLNVKYSHATVMYLISSFLKKKHIYQFGIRSACRSEWKLAMEKNNFFPYHLKNFLKAIKEINPEQAIYISIDLDVLDPSVLPGTGTPEPGGVSFTELLESLYLLKDKNIVGADIVELAPHYDPSGVSNIVAAKLVRELLLIL